MDFTIYIKNFFAINIVSEVNNCVGDGTSLLLCLSREGKNSMQIMSIGIDTKCRYLSGKDAPGRFSTVRVQIIKKNKNHNYRVASNYLFSLWLPLPCNDERSLDIIFAEYVVCLYSHRYVADLFYHHSYPKFQVSRSNGGIVEHRPIGVVTSRADE